VAVTQAGFRIVELGSPGPYYLFSCFGGASDIFSEPVLLSEVWPLLPD
jgi:hypothetical protein